MPPDQTPRNVAKVDALCGPGWAWDGVRCVANAEPSAAASGLGGPRGGGSGRGGATTGTDATSGPSDGESTATQLVIHDLSVGTGVEAKQGDSVAIHYVGTLADGTEFDSSRKRGTPLEFRLGGGQVIKGFDRAVTGMKVGGKREVTIPPELGYGRRGVPPMIPPNATLKFDLELMDVH